MPGKTALMIEDELKHPDKYKPITQGPCVAMLLMLALGSLVPMWMFYQRLRRWLSSGREAH
jgi:hypothetical protein